MREADESGAVAVFLGEQADVDAWFKAEAITCDQCVKQSTPIVQTLVHRRDVQIQVQKIHIGLKRHNLGGRNMLKMSKLKTDACLIGLQFAVVGVGGVGRGPEHIYLRSQQQCIGMIQPVVGLFTAVRRVYVYEQTIHFTYKTVVDGCMHGKLVLGVVGGVMLVGG